MTNGLIKRAALYIGILAFALVLLLFLGAGQASAEDVSGDIVGDVVWASGGVYNVTGDVNVVGNLTIEDDVAVVFQGDFDFNVVGSLTVEGTAENPVVFSWNDSLGTYWGILNFVSGSSGSLSFVNISHCDGIFLDNVSVPISNVNLLDVAFGIYGEFYGMEQDVSLAFSDININNTAFAAVVILNDNGSLDITLERFSIDHGGAIGYLIADQIDLNVIDSTFNDATDGLYVGAGMIGTVQITGSTFANILGDEAVAFYDVAGDMSLVIEGAVFENIEGEAIYVESDSLVYFELANTTFEDVSYYCVELYSLEGDMEFIMNNVTMTDFDSGFYAETDNGSIVASLSEVHTDGSRWIGGWWAYSMDDSARLDLTVTDSTFNDTIYGFWLYSETSGSVSMTNVELTNVYVDGAITVDPYESMVPYGDLSIELTNVLMDNVHIGIDPAIEGNISLVMESVQMNDTFELGWFVAFNDDNNAVIDVVMSDCVFSNATYGFYFEADTVGEFEITNTVFSGIEYYAMSMVLDYADMIVPIEGVQANGVGAFLELTVTFGNVDLVITDSVLEGNYAPGSFLIDVTVNSNRLDNGFITLTVANSVLKNASGGIRTWSEELNPIDLTTALFENITGEAMHFDVRSGDLDFTFVDDDLTVVNSGTGLWAYANNGDINVDMSGVSINTHDFGLHLEVSSLSAEGMSVINMNIVDCVFEDGAYGVYALSLNGGVAVVDNSQFLGQSERAYWFDSLYGEMDVEIAESVFDGSEAADMTVYTVEEVENTFKVIGWNNWNWGEDAWSPSTVWTEWTSVDLPFAFVYNGLEYTSVYLSSDGYLDFGGGNRIEPVGSTDLIYSSGYGARQFYGYRIAEDGTSVMFHWYASEAISGSGLSMAFQVVLFADGTIQFNYADMESYSYDIPYGLTTDSTIYDLRSLYGMPKEDADWMAFLFTPLPLSYGMGVLLTMEEGDINAAITNSTFSSYYGGGIAVLSLNGGLVLEVTGSEFSKIYNNEFSALDVYNFNGAAELTMADNTFERIWGLAIHLDLTSTEGGERTIDVSDSVFDKVAYVFYAEIGVDDSSGRTGDDSMNVTIIFRNNMLTDAYGMFCDIELELNDPVNWTVTVAQTMTNNTMVQENYLGSWPFPENYPEAPSLGAFVWIEQRGEDENSVTLEQTATVTGNHIECPWDMGIAVGNDIDNLYGDTARTFAVDISENFVSCTGEIGIIAASMMTAGTGLVVDDATVTIDDNEVVDGSYNAIAIGVMLSVDSNDGVGQSCDARIGSLVSVCGNRVEGALGGVYTEIVYEQENMVGDWNVTSTTHVDGNRLLNVSYAIGAYLGAGAFFGEHYWPPENEVAVANMVLDYVLTVDDNIVLCPYNMDFYNSMIEVGIECWAGVSVSTLCAQVNVWVTGTLSISGNELTELDGDLSGIDLYHGIGAEKTASIHADVAVAVEDNVLTVLWENDGPGPRPPAAIRIDNELSGQSNNNVITPGPMVKANMTWSVTGNEVTSGFRYGIEVLDEVELEGGLASTAYTVSWDISGNTLTDVKECGVCYDFSREEYSNGAFEMDVAVDITDNVISLVDGPDNWAGIYLDSCDSTSSWEYWDEQYGNHTFVASVSGNTISGAEDGLEIYGTLYFDVPDDYEPAEDEVLYTYVNDIVVESNYISDCLYGMYLYDAMDVRNNIVECAIGAETYGIYWYEAEGEMVGNTITAEIGVYVDYLHHWLVQGNLVQFGATGISVESYNDEEDADGAIIDNTITALENPFLPWESYCIVLDETPNVLISGNVLSGADYGVYMEDVWNITISGNNISDCGASVHIYEAQFVWVEANTMTGSEYGVYVDSGVEDLVIGNNTFIRNYYGIEMWTEIHRMTLWNNVFIDNEYGVDISTLYMEAVWYVDDECQASRSDIYFEGPVYILAGGAMLLEDMEMYVEANIPVAEGGLLSMSNVAIDAWGLEVQGTIWANLCSFNDMNLYLMPGSMGEVRASTFLEAEIIIDACDPVLADNLIIAYDDYGIRVGNGAAPTIVSNIIAMSAVGIYANGMDMGGIYDNLIVASYDFGLLAENCTGGIHDNVFLLNKVEIMLRNSDVSVEDNEIGFTDLFQVAADYAPLLGLLTGMNGEGIGLPTTDDPLAILEAMLPSDGFDLVTWITAHTGIWAERSVVETSGNAYGMLNYAVYAVDSEVHFADDIRTGVVTIPWVHITSLGEVVERNYTVSVHTLNGIHVVRSELYVTGSTIEVLDDALVLEASEGWVEGATLLAGDYDYFLFGGSEVYNIATTYETRKVEDSHSLNEGTWLTITAIDEGEPVANLTIYIRSANGEIVKTVVTDAEGKARVLLAQYAWTLDGKDDGFNPYTINATFESGEASMEVTLNQSYMDVTLEGEKESNIGAILAVVGVLVILLLIVAAVVVMRRRK